MARRLPSLNALRCFETVAAQLSIKKAAAALHISESAVSRQVRILEDQLGLVLFRRSHSGLEITEAGKALAASTGGAFDQIARTIDSFQRDQDTVQIKVLPTLALRWLYPRLRRFQAQNPLIQVVVHTRWHDMISGDGEAELGIRYGLGNWARDCVTELYPEWLAPVCAPDYVSGRKLETAEDFDRCTLLHPQPNHDDWRVWCAGWGGGDFNTDGGLDFDVLDMALRAAEAGFGLAISDVVLAQDTIEAGQLVAPIDRAVPSGVSYFLVRPPDLSERRQVRLLHEWICDEMSDSRKIIDSYRH
ncbi:MAG: LysR substrate-binding domain-containing protein [Phenylobacterium sp.]|uniref:LysR substrate-binding domain-containing protein n=1 Tax=Phenylobacterium sp. TaxID=1871053 RepID=UPI002735D37B|nr:LysR substrate-binding domain-containing protein [Phenylobacterium sp.]MDP3746556.1 LysR substrate-binding domain-containing protein [Phenylobacterium sp.]